MHTPSCPCPPQRPRLRRFLNDRLGFLAHPRPDRKRGQVIVIFAFALLTLLAFVGLVVDAGSLYITYGQLKRAVDAASVAAANDYKRNVNVTQMQNNALELLKLHNVDITTVNLQVFTCPQNPNDPSSWAPGLPADFAAKCPDITAGKSARKLVWVQASEKAPLYFLSLIGFDAVTLTTNAMSEAATVDLVIVIDTSESMGVNTLHPSPYTVDDYDPNDPATGCNPTNTCEPLLQAKDAAKALIDNLYGGYDRVGVVTFDTYGIVRHGLDDNLAQAKADINSIPLHDDPPYAKLWPAWKAHPGSFNPVNPDDRDGDGQDYDNPLILGYTCPAMSDPRMADRWWSSDNIEKGPDPYGWGGVPCDADNGPGDPGGYIYDAYDWDQSDSTTNGKYTQSDTDYANAWVNGGTVTLVNGSKVTLTSHLVNIGSQQAVSFSPLSTCTGCGIRVATDMLKSGGRPSSVWVMVFLSDGLVNLSDTHLTQSKISEQNGFCGGGLNSEFWKDACTDPTHANPRYCINVSSDTCPLHTTYLPGPIHSPPYSVENYARDMTDQAALQVLSQPKELLGNDIAIYTIGLGAAAPDGEPLLRYMAAVGDDGDRSTDPCAGVPSMKSCGQYFYAPTGDALRPIFDQIASRIYTRISN